MFDHSARNRRSLAALEGVRAPAVAGLFYPDDPDALRRTVGGLLEDGLAATDRATGRVKAVIAPHAGYRYSGPIAGSAFAAWDRDRADVERVIVLGPSHHVAFRGIALPPARALAIPGGCLPVDLEAAEKLLDQAAVAVDRAPHLREHALEVELPFVQALFGAVAVVPLVVGETSVAAVRQALDAVWGSSETRLVISSDLSHFLPYDTARAVDLDTANRIERLDGTLRPDQACGARAINGLLACCRERAMRVVRLDLRNSGDTAGGRDRVVGYGAWAFLEGA